MVVFGDILRQLALLVTTERVGAAEEEYLRKAIWVVNRSWTWGRLANPSTSLASLDNPVTRPSGPGM